ncbi:MAG: methyltransferase domain-containing protein [Patescibacteria group bacterium]|nr:methyltransferase domain-containing protein [Patescibacteria group bacterium]
MKYTGERMIPEANKEEEMYLEHMSRYLFASQFVKDKVVLDIACGSGYGTDLLLQAGAKKVIGVDISEESIYYCRENYKNKNLEFVVGSVANIPLKDKSVDTVVSFETIEHVNEEDQLKFLKETRRVLKPKGLFLVSTPNPLVYPKENPFHLKELSLDEFKDVLADYFSAAEFFFQDDVNSSYILSEGNIKKEILVRAENEPKIRKINKLKPLDSSFLIAVCSNSKIDQRIDEYVTMFNLKSKDEVKRMENVWEERIKRKDIEIAKIKNTVQQKEEELKKKADSCKIEIKEATINLRKKIEEKEEIIQQKEKILARKKRKMDDLAQEIKLMKSSKFWKAREKYINLKNKLGIK